MAQINAEWGRCILGLLAKHGLTPRAAMFKSNGAVSHTTIIDWSRGIVPIQIRDKVWPFLSAFPREEAMECLRAASLPVPPEWEATDPDELIRKYVLAQRGHMSIGQMKEHVLGILEEEANEPDGFEPEL